MGLFTSQKFENLDDLFHEQLKDLYDAESRISEALPKMAEAAGSQQLASAFREHRQETEGQIARLDKIFKLLGQKPQRETCEAIKGLIAEGEEVVKAKGDSRVKDAGLIASAQRVEHYEMAGYGTARNFAERLGHNEAADLLQQTLDEEKATDGKLSQLATEVINPQAANA